MGRKLKQEGHSPTVYFKLFDESKWEMIDKLMTLPQYAKSRNALIVNALGLGLPMLIKEEFGEIALDEDENENGNVKMFSEPLQIETIPDKLITEMIRLLNEIAMNSTLNKYMLCGLFTEREEKISSETPGATGFSRGKYNHIPDCLFDMEIEMLKEMSPKGEVE